MSKGTTVYSLRVPQDLARELEEEIAHRERQPTQIPWSFTSFVLTAIAEKLRHARRSRRTKRRKAAPPA